MTNNSNFPLGFIAYGRAEGAAWTGATNEYPVASGYATSLFRGDPLLTLADGTLGIGTAGNPVRGVMWGTKYINSTNQVNWASYWPASTTVQTGTLPVLEVIDDPYLLFDIQEANASGVAGTPLALTDVGANFNFHSGTGNTASGNSGYWLDNSTASTTATENCRLMRLTPRINNVVGSFANWLVQFNAHELKAGTVGVTS